MNAQTNNRRNDYLDYLKGILIVLVIYGHTIQYIVYKQSAEFWNDPAFKFIYIFHMPLFMGVSGFISYAFMGRNTAFEAIKKRFLQLVVPIFCWSVIHQSALAFAYVSADKFGADRALIMLPGLILNATIEGFWFLRCVFISSVIVAVLRLIKLDRAAVFAVIGIVILFLPDMYVLDHMFRYIFPFFCAGYSLAKWKNDLLPLEVPAYWILAGIAVSLISYAMWTKDSYVYVTGMELTGVNLFNVPFRYVSGAAVSAAFLVLTSLMYKYFTPKILTALGRASMSIYILQTFFFIIASRFAPIYDNPVLLSLTVAPALAFLIGISFDYLALGIRRFSLPRKLLLGDFKQRTRTHQHAVADA
jgi:fucose 4-O-acetylase-like acetyltransferase